MSVMESMARHPAGKRGNNAYALYVAGSKSPEALAAKAAYVRERRQAGSERMSGYGLPTVERRGGTITALMSQRQVEILDALRQDGANTTRIGRRVGVTAETVRRHLRVICDTLDFEDRTALLAAILHGDVTYRERR